MKKELVFDSSTAILLAKIHLLNMVTENLRVIFPEAVKEETTRKKESFDSKLIIRLIDENKINVAKANQSEVNKIIEDFSTEVGESEAIEIASRKKCALATDDWPSMRVCKILDIKFLTAIHFLINFYEKKLLEKNVALEKLRSLQKYGRYSYDIIKDAKNRIEGE